MISQRTYWLLTTFIISVSVTPILIADGMFMDGLQYSCIARNMSIGEGTIWFPKYIEYWHRNDSPFFLEQPPTAYWLESVLFRILGDQPFIEELYSFIILTISAVFIHLIWKTVFYQNDNDKQLSWLPISLWILIPTVHWSFGNNMLETNLTMFCLSATYFYLKSMFSKHSTGWVSLFAISIMGAFLSKGFPGLFPIILPIIGYLILGTVSLRRVLFDYLITIIITLCIIGIFPLIDDAQESFQLYLNNRVLNSIKNVSIVSNRLFIIWTLVNQLSYLLILFGLSLLFRKKVKPSFTEENAKWTGSFLLLGLCGSIPLMITKEQRGFYLCTSMVFYAIGFSIYFIPFVKYFQTQINFSLIKYSKLIQSVLIICTITLPFYLSEFENRDLEELKLVEMIRSDIPRKSTITIPHQMWSNWSLHANLQRELQINLSTDKQTQFFLVDSRINIEVPSKFKKTTVATDNYQLYKHDSTTSPTNR